MHCREETKSDVNVNNSLEIGAKEISEEFARWVQDNTQNPNCDNILNQKEKPLYRGSCSNKLQH